MHSSAIKKHIKRNKVRSFSLLFISIVGFLKMERNIFSAHHWLLGVSVVFAVQLLFFFVKDLSVCWLLASLLPQSGTTIPIGQCKRICFFMSASRRWVRPVHFRPIWTEEEPHSLAHFLSVQLLKSRWITLNLYVQISIFKPIFFFNTKES